MADLVRCLDDIKQDKRVDVIWNLPRNKPLPYRDILDKTSIKERLITPILGITALISISILAFYIPIPEESSVGSDRTERTKL